MTAEGLTLISGIALLIVIALVIWNVRRRQPKGRNERSFTDETR